MSSISEHGSKKPRGRPRLLSRDHEAALRIIYAGAGVKSSRSIRNKSWLVRAAALVRNDPRFRWLVDDARDVFRSTILTELGRVADDADLFALAAQICELKPSAGEAVAMLRQARPDLIVRTIDRYVATHPDCTGEQVSAALAAARDRAVCDG